MKIVCISDTHDYHNRISLPPGDVLVHAGDLTMRGTFMQVAAFGNWFKDLPYKYKICIAGNHDFLFEDNRVDAKALVHNEDKGAIYLQDENFEVDGVKFYGSPWQPWFHDWAFNLDRYDGSLAKKWRLIPDDTNVLIVHGPPKGILDKTLDGQHVGCYDLYNRIQELKDLKLFICGHIHESYGKVETPSTVFVNASICDRFYDPTHKPIVVEI